MCRDIHVWKTCRGLFMCGGSSCVEVRFMCVQNMQGLFTCVKNIWKTCPTICVNNVCENVCEKTCVKMCAKTCAKNVCEKCADTIPVWGKLMCGGISHQSEILHSLIFKSNWSTLNYFIKYTEISNIKTLKSI